MKNHETILKYLTFTTIFVVFVFYIIDLFYASVIIAVLSALVLTYFVYLIASQRIAIWLILLLLIAAPWNILVNEYQTSAEDTFSNIEWYPDRFVVLNGPADKDYSGTLWVDNSFGSMQIQYYTDGTRIINDFEAKTSTLVGAPELDADGEPHLKNIFVDGNVCYLIFYVYQLVETGYGSTTYELSSLIVETTLDQPDVIVQIHEYDEIIQNLFLYQNHLTAYNIGQKQILVLDNDLDITDTYVLLNDLGADSIYPYGDYLILLEQSGFLLYEDYDSYLDQQTFVTPDNSPFSALEFDGNLVISYYNYIEYEFRLAFYDSEMNYIKTEPIDDVNAPAFGPIQTIKELEDGSIRIDSEYNTLIMTSDFISINEDYDSRLSVLPLAKKVEIDGSVYEYATFTNDNTMTQAYIIKDSYVYPTFFQTLALMDSSILWYGVRSFLLIGTFYIASKLMTKTSKQNNL